MAVIAWIAAGYTVGGLVAWRTGSDAAAPFRIVGGHTASIELHRSCGFREVGVEREVGRKFRRWLDVTIVQRVL